MNRSGICATVSSPRVGWSPRRASRPASSVRQRRSKRSRSSSIRSYSSRGGSDRSRSTSRDAHRVGRDPAERHGLRIARRGPARSRPASTGPSPRDGRAPRPAPSGPRPSRRRPRPAATARRPRSAGRVGGEPGPGRAGSCRAVSSMAPVWHARRSMDGHDQRPARPPRLTAPPPAGETRDDADRSRRAPPTRPAPGSTRTPTPRPPTSCRSRASTTSSSGSATPARRRPTTARCGASPRSRSAASRPRSATGPATSWSRTTSGSCSPRR